VQGASKGNFWMPPKVRSWKFQQKEENKKAVSIQGKLLTYIYSKIILYTLKNVISWESASKNTFF